jgi:hypothetical protein
MTSVDHYESGGGEGVENEAFECFVLTVEFFVGPS